jgi:hypothetical protein
MLASYSKLNCPFIYLVISYCFAIIIFSDQNTWEPVENMAACDKLVETFERNLARQKAMQQKAASQLSHQQKLNQGIAEKSLIKVKSSGKPEEMNQPGPSGVTNIER